MNKKILAILGMTLLLSGCTSKITCTLEGVSGSNYESVVEIEANGNKITDATLNATYGSEDLATSACNILKTTDNENIECDGKEITVKKYDEAVSIDDVTKDKLVDFLKGQGYTCK